MKTCQWCETEYSNGNLKFCSKKCQREYLDAVIDFRTKENLYSNKSKARWMRNNPLKRKAHDAVNKNPHNIIILRECACPVPVEDKIKHHPDYNKPYEVERLCPACHRAEHKRLRKELINGTRRSVPEDFRSEH